MFSKKRKLAQQDLDSMELDKHALLRVIGGAANALGATAALARRDREDKAFNRGLLVGMAMVLNSPMVPSIMTHEDTNAALLSRVASIYRKWGRNGVTAVFSPDDQD